MIKLKDLITERSSDWWHRDASKYWELYLSDDFISEMRKIHSKDQKKAVRKLYKHINEDIFHKLANKTLIRNIVYIITKHLMFKIDYKDMINQIVKEVKKSGFDNTKLSKWTAKNR